MAGPQPGDRISEYVLDDQIGAGSFGQVWKAHHHIWKEEIVAIKTPTDSQYVRNLQKEGSAIHGLGQENIVRAIGLDPYAEVPYFVLEYVNGCSLRELIDAHPDGMPIRAAQRITCGILRALDHAHSNNVIHRDIKPANILIAGGNVKPPEELAIGDIKVTDFGLGKVGQTTTTSILQSGSLLSEEGRSISGTLAYMAPEQRDGGETDARSDLYAVGIVLFEMLCGERPSGSDMPSDIRDGLPSWVDPAYSHLYTRRERRFASAAEALATIDETSIPPVVTTGETVAGQDHTPGLCPSCKVTTMPGDNFCILCGMQLVEHLRRCLYCGGFPNPEDQFCIFCGTQLPVGIG